MSDTKSSDLEEVSSPSPVSTSAVGSPMHTMPNDFRSALDDFRVNWQRELKGQSGNSTPTISGSPQKENKDDDEILSAFTCTKSASEAERQSLAESLYRKAVELEQRGKVYDAVPFYRKAVQIVPDIEFKFYERQKQKASAISEATAAKPFRPPNQHEPEAESEAFVADLYEKFQMDFATNGGKMLLNSRDPSVITTNLHHISDLPTEILLFILRWVVSTQLDMRSLEQCAAVSRGMYLYARDEEIWRMACVRVWGVNVGTPSNPTATGSSDIIPPEFPIPCYNSWRHMFIERERVLFNGCYISKTTYLRMGENSFQDQYYRPVQLVEYYRYIRFLSDGTVLMMTNADEPAQAVNKLKSIQQLRSDVLRGHYQLYGSTVTVILKKQQRSFHGAQQFVRQRRGSLAFADDMNTTQYCMEFRIMSTPKRKFVQLVWQHYSIVQTRNQVETSTEFDLAQSKYPPLWFSQVRSYHLSADAPLT